MPTVQIEEFNVPFPTSIKEWNVSKQRVMKILQLELGRLPNLFTPRPHIFKKTENKIYSLEEFSFDNGVGDTVYGYLAIPLDRTEPVPAIIYHHCHAGQYAVGKEEILKKGPGNTPPVEALTKAGYAVLSIDAYAFGERASQGPAGKKETGQKTEEALFKMFLWQGKTLWGMMVRDDQLALNYLMSRPEINPKSIGAMGMSMGSTRTWWLSAMDERIKVSVCAGCLTRYQNLIQSGEINQHSIYYFIPNLLDHGIDMEAVVGLIAPRPLLTLTGDQDEGSPAEGVRIINNFVKKLYALHNSPKEFKGVLYPGVGHKFTPEMWKEALTWFDKKFK